ncbi:hypothetical protein MKW92_007400 [Papaver armeniacum]|nr:hypothetical protein MKW92_007400 [Papaver armeniacum]
MQHLGFAGSRKQSSGKSMGHGQRPITLYLDTASCKQPSNAKDPSSPVQERASFLLCSNFSGGSEFKALSNKHEHSYHHLNCRRNLHIRESIQAHA